MVEQQPSSRVSMLSVTTTSSQPGSSARVSQENRDPSVRHYRSMLVVDAPALRPLKPMDYSELYGSDGLCSDGISTFWCLLQHSSLPTSIIIDSVHVY